MPFPHENISSPEAALHKAVAKMEQLETSMSSGKDLLQLFFNTDISKYIEKDGDGAAIEYELLKQKLVNSDWDFKTVIEIMTMPVLKAFDQWMLEQGYIPYGWTGYDGDTTDDYYQGKITKWFSDTDSKGSTIPRYTEYSGCRIQFIDANDEDKSLLEELLARKMGTHGGNHHSNIHDTDNDILAGRKIIVFRESNGECHLFFSKLQGTKHFIANLSLDKSLTQDFDDKYFETDKMFGTLNANEESDIPNELILKIDQLIQKNEGQSFLACWSAIYLSRLIRVYGGYVETDERGIAIAEDAAMNRIYLAKELLEQENHVYLSELDMENTGVGNHLAIQLHQKAANNSTKTMALTAPERLLDDDDQGEETILIGSGMPGKIISIPCCRKISTFALKLAINPREAEECGLSAGDMEYLTTAFPTIEKSSMTQKEDNSIHVKSGEKLELLFTYNGNFVFTTEFINDFLKINKNLTIKDLKVVDGNGNTMLMHAAKTGNKEMNLQDLAALNLSNKPANLLIRDLNKSDYLLASDSGFSPTEVNTRQNRIL